MSLKAAPVNLSSGDPAFSGPPDLASPAILADPDILLGMTPITAPDEPNSTSFAPYHVGKPSFLLNPVPSSGCAEEPWDDTREEGQAEFPDLAKASNRAVENLHAASLAVERLMGNPNSSVFPY